MKFWHELNDKEELERWENVLRVLRALTPHERKKHFQMDYWGKKTDCGTIGCAAGFCGLDPWFRRRGFKMNFYKVGEDEKEQYPGVTHFGEVNMGVAEFFGHDGAQIFLDAKPRSAGVVIKEVKAYIKQLKQEQKWARESASDMAVADIPF
jgi:hypothetical protein